MKNPKSILITGASSGIGAALARLYANPGSTLALSGRNRDRLDEVARHCRTLGAAVSTRRIDVTDRAAMAKWIGEADALRPLDLVVANAGVSLGWTATDSLDNHFEETFSTNVQGVFNTVGPAVEPMRRRQRGQIAVMSSLAGFHGLPSSPAYSVSKVAVKAYGEALRGLLRVDGIEVSVICPGFVISPMTARNSFHMPFLMPVDRAARIIRLGLEHDKARIAFPFPLLAMIRLLSLLPECWLDPLLSKVPAKR